jgi:hypothetical protein
MVTVFSVEFYPRLYNEDLRPTEERIEEAS